MPAKFPYKDAVIPPSKGHLKVDHELCACCCMCVQTCSLKNYRVGSHILTNIQMLSYSNYEWDAFAVVCEQCDDPACMRACPVGAIEADPVTGARVVNQEACIGCKRCIKACPFEPKRLVYDPRVKKVSKCNLCGGDPACVKACPMGALTYEFTEEPVGEPADAITVVA